MNYISERLYIISLFIFTLFFRSIVRMMFSKRIDFNTYYHLFMIDFIRKNATLVTIEYKRFIKLFGINYPWIVYFNSKAYSTPIIINEGT